MLGGPLNLADDVTWVVRTKSRTLRGQCGAVSRVFSGEMADTGRSVAIAGKRCGLSGDDRTVDGATHVRSIGTGVTQPGAAGQRLSRAPTAAAHPSPGNQLLSGGVTVGPVSG